MKCISAIPVIVAMGLTACETINRPVTGARFDPLQAPGSDQTMATANSATFAAGQFVRAIMDNTAFFKERPKADADADKLLARGTSMKVISSSESYVKVELDSGEIGWVPAVMLEEPNTAAPVSDPFAAPSPGEYQLYPPAGGFDAALPQVTPGELPPEGAIPTVIDPETPAVPSLPVVPSAPTPLPEPYPPSSGN
jgi:hypothetical protein